MPIKKNYHLAEEIFDKVITYAATKNPKQDYTAVIAEIANILELVETKQRDRIPSYFLRFRR